MVLVILRSTISPVMANSTVTATEVESRIFHKSDKLEKRDLIAGALPAMRSRFSSLSLLWKILLSTSVAVTVLFAITGEIVLRNITKTMSDSLEEEVQESFHAYDSLWNSRAEALSTV